MPINIYSVYESKKKEKREFLSKPEPQKHHNVNLRIFFAPFLFRLITNQWLPRMGRNFDDHPDFQQKARNIYEILRNTLSNALHLLLDIASSVSHNFMTRRNYTIPSPPLEGITSILLIQGPISEILATIPQLLGVN
jgi:hypothetical protein